MPPIEHIYLDYNATALARPEVITTVTEAMAEGGNPSSVHGRGRKARARVEAARAQVAALVNALATEVVFTGTGTEATDIAINGVAPANEITDLVVCAIDHPASHGAAERSPLPVTTLPVTRQGVVDLDAAEKILIQLAAEGRKVMLVVMRANNETGVLQPVQELSQMVRDRNLGLVHCDAVQAAGKVPVDIVMLGADTMSLAAHKIGGPQGVGALVVREGVAVNPRILGGGQEMGRRSGTENVAGIAGYGVAAALARQELERFAKLSELRDRLEGELRQTSNNIVIFGEGAARLPNTLNFSVPGVSAETALMLMDLAGVEISAGSACSAGKVGYNKVLGAMGFGKDEMAGALRVSFGWGSVPGHVDRFMDVWRGQVLRAQSARQATVN